MIACRMSLGIIDLLEEVDIQQEETCRSVLRFKETGKLRIE